MTRPLVAHVITQLDVGGAQETLIRSAIGLAPGWASVVVVGRRVDGDEGNEERLTDAGIPVVRIPDLGRSIDPVADVRALRRLRACLTDLAPAAVHTHSSKAGILGRRAAASAGVGAVLHTVHGWSFRDTDPMPRRVAYELLERRAARWCHRLVVVTDVDRRIGLARSIGDPGQYRLVRSGVDLDAAAGRSSLRADLGLGTEVPLVGMVARLAPPKDPVTLVQAFAAMPERPEPAHLVLVGDGELRAAVEAEAVAAGCSHRVHVTGLRADAPAAVAELDVAVLSSRSEGLPRSVIEAMAAAVPVVATDVGGVAEAIQHDTTGILVAAGDASAMGAAVRRLLDDAGCARSMAAAGRDRARAFGQEQMVADLATLYEEATGGRPEVAV